MVRLSLCMIVRNSEKGIEQCLKSAAPFVDEIVVVDTGSTDATVEIVSRYAHCLAHRPWTDNFSEARNAALELATGDWILVLDSDEALAPDAGPGLRAALQSDTIIAYQLLIKNFLDDSAHTQDVYVLRLFRNSPAIRYQHRIHEQISETVRAYAEAHGRLVGRLPLAIHHFGYMPGYNTGRSARNIHLLERSLEDLPEDPYFMDKLAGECQLHQPARALELRERATRHLLDEAPEALQHHRYAIEVFAHTIQQRARVEGADRALELCDTVMQRLAPHPLLHYLRAILLIQKGNIDLAQLELLDCIHLPTHADDIYFDVQEVLERSHLLLGEQYYRQGFYLRAQKHFQQVLESSSENSVATSYLLRIQALLGEPGAALKESLAWFKRSQDVEAALTVGELLIGLGQLEPAARWIAGIERDFASQPETLARVSLLKGLLSAA